MRAGFFRRLISALVDISIALAFVYLTFILFGQNILQNRVDNYQEIDANYQEVINQYYEDQEAVENEYNLAKESAGDDEDARNEAYLVYRDKLSILNHHYAADSSVYNRLLLDYNVGLIYYFTLGMIVLLGLIIIGFKGLTPGRRLLRIELVGQVSMINIIIHDLLLKYILVVVLFLISPYYAFIILPAYFLLDLFLILLSKDKSTLRDNLSKIVLNYKPKKNKKNEYN
ncbi:RDD family protein [Mycoplasmatota bacterium]|nr:RDD family protein [Mycoplasmatota bacterium]